MKLPLKSALAGILLLLSAAGLIAQKSPSKFGEIDIKDLEMSYSPIDSSAGAETLLDFGLTTFDHNFDISLQHHVRIKIFNSTEFDRGDIKIPYGSKDHVSKLKASTYNLENGKMVESKLDKKNIFTEEVSEGVKQKRFSLPNVKVGSIIEYSYTVGYGSWGRLSNWYFQQSIPVRHSEYIVSLPEYFKYRQIMKGFVKLAAYETTSKNGTYGGSNFRMDVTRFVAKDVTPFKDEPYMTSRGDYISNVSFELASIYIPGQVDRNYLPASYFQMSKELAGKEFYGTDLVDNKFLKEEVAKVVKAGMTEMEKVQAIFEYVQDNIEYDGDDSESRLRQILNNKKANRTNTNRFTVAMLNEVGIESNIVWLSTRSHGRIHPVYPMQSNFNYTVACARVGEEDILLDASEKDIPFGVLPEKCINDKGLVISKNARWVSLTPKVGNQLFLTGSFEVDMDGIILGKIDISRGGYSAIDFRDDNEDAIDDYKTDFAENHATWIIDKHEVEGMEDVKSKVKESIEMEIEDYAEMAGDLLIFNPFLYSRMEENPFESKERLFPVNYGAPYNKTVSYRIQIPDGYVVDELPQPLAIGLPNKSGTFLYQIQQVGNSISLTSRFIINRTEFQAEEYGPLREFYAQVVAKQAESVVLKQQ